MEEGRIYSADLLIKFSGGNSKVLFNINSMINPIVTCPDLSAIVCDDLLNFLFRKLISRIMLHIERSLNDLLLTSIDINFSTVDTASHVFPLRVIDHKNHTVCLEYLICN